MINGPKSLLGFIRLLKRLYNYIRKMTLFQYYLLSLQLSLFVLPDISHSDLLAKLGEDSENKETNHKISHN